MKHAIRSICSEDWPAIERIQAESYPREVLESLEALQSHWRVSCDTCVVVESDEQVVGYLLAHPWPKRMIPPLNKVYGELPDDSDCLFIHDLALSPIARKAGLAQDLVRSVLQSGAQMRLTAASLIAVQGSEGFWKRFGFTVCDTLADDFIAAVRCFYPASDFSYMERCSLDQVLV
ncbi:MAG: family N-acetyltransferase [Schlesneria sp.]|nr:family N-acetyltransferase [Schlesneria sp.]